MSPLSARTTTLGSAGGIGRRRPDPTPWGWEVPTAGLLAWLSVAAATLLAAQGAAAWLTGNGWLWPDSPHLFSAIGALVTGHVGVGVDAPDGLPSPFLVVVVAVVLELILLVLTVWAARWFWTTAGPGRRLGMATRADAETALGAGRLRRVRKLIRPDLYGPPPAQTRSRVHGRQPSTTPSSDATLSTLSTSAGSVAGSVAGSITDSVDAGLAAARTNPVRFHRPPDAQPSDASTSGPVHQAAIRTDLGGPVSGPRSGHRFSPAQVGWRLGSGAVPRAGELWVPFDRTTGVYGPQGSGKTLDLLTPALLSAPGAALVTLTKAEDLLLTVDHRAEGGRPVAVLDPFGLAPGLPELVWDPVDGCVDSMVAERRAKAFTAGTVRGAVAQGAGDSAARFYAAEGAKVLQAYFHAAALTGRSIEDVLEWVANPRGATTPEEILRTHPHAAPFWHGLLHGALHGDDRTAGNTTTTVQQAMALFFQASLRARCTPGPGRPATDLPDLIGRSGTIYLLGRDDPYASASPLMTAIAEHVLDTALQVAGASPWGRLCPPFLACLDELPSTAPLPTLRTRMANERALGLSFIYAAQTWRQLVICYGEDEARALFGLTNVIAVFGGSKDGLFNRELSDLIGTARVSRTTYNRGHGFSGSGGTSHASSDEPILRPEEIRTLPERHALIVSENAKPLIARLTRCVDSKPGRQLLDAQTAVKARVAAARGHQQPMFARTTAAVTTAQHLNLSPRPVAEQRPSRIDDDHEASPEQAGQQTVRQTVRQTGERVGGLVMVRPDPARMAEPFPLPPRLVQSAYAKLEVVLSGDQERIAALGPLERLDHPWEPARCGRPLRAELWLWLDDVAAWVNHDYGWGVERLIPPCWPAHPHIAHELAVLADQRYSAGLAFHGGSLEEWHRYSLPLFLERMTTRLGSRCVSRHDEWPAVARFHSYTSQQSVTERWARFDDDASTTSSTASTSRHLALVDLDSAEIIDDGGQP